MFKNNEIRTDDVKVVMKQLLEAINHLHQNKVCHKDIKPENVMIDPETLKIKLIDFNVS